MNIREKDQPGKGKNPGKRKKGRKSVIYVVVLLLVIIIFAVLYFLKSNNSEMTGTGTGQSVSKSTEPQFVKQGELTFFRAGKNQIVKIDIEIADTDDKREKGLMDRRQMDQNRGMLFIFEDEDQRSFWMKNTYLPLDILYVDALKKIVSIHENCATLDERAIPSDFPAKYVVEVVAGFTAMYNIRTGDTMTFTR